MNILELANAAAELEDQTQTTTGGDFEYSIPEAGATVARLIEYIELGKHTQKPYLGKAKPDADMVKITFELLHPQKNVKKIEVDGKEQEITETLSITIKKSMNEKASYKKLFNKMQYGRADKRHMAQMLGDAFRVEIQHNSTGEGKDKKTYANLNDSEGVYHIGAPVSTRTSEDGLTEEKVNIKVPPARRPMRLFLWDLANKDMWDTIFIDGTREVKVGDKTETVSKNYLQEKILSAKNYPGSPVELMLNGVDKLPVTETSNEAEPMTPADTKDEDPMAALGLSV